MPMDWDELDKARLHEALRLWVEQGRPLDNTGVSRVGSIAARLARENWMPPRPSPNPDKVAKLKARIANNDFAVMTMDEDEQETILAMYEALERLVQVNG